MNITSKQIKGLARLLSNASAMPYMAALDSVSERLSGLKWNVLTTKLGSDKREGEHELPHDAALYKSCDNAFYDAFCSGVNLTPFLPLAPHEQDIVNDLKAKMPGLDPSESLLRWLFSRTSPIQPIKPSLRNPKSYAPDIDYCEAFVKDGYYGATSFSFDNGCRAKEKMKVFLEYPALILVFLNGYLDLWKHDTAKCLWMDFSIQCVANFESSSVEIYETLVGAGYTDNAIELLKCPEIASGLSHLMRQGRSIDIPPPALLNPAASSAKSRSEVKRALFDAQNGLTVSLFELTGMDTTKILMSLKSDRGLDAIHDWSGVTAALNCLSRMVSFSTSRGGFETSLFMGWSILYVFSPTSQRYIKWLGYRVGGCAASCYERTKLSSFYVYDDVMAMSKAGNTVAPSLSEDAGRFIGSERRGRHYLPWSQVSETIKRYPELIADPNFRAEMQSTPDAVLSAYSKEAGFWA